MLQTDSSDAGKRCFARRVRATRRALGILALVGCGGTEPLPVPVPVPVASVVVSGPQASVIEHGTVLFTATLTDINGNPATGRVVTWSSNNQMTLSVGPGGDTSATAVVPGSAAANLPGSATIYATCEGKTGSFFVTVIPGTVANVTAFVFPTTIKVGANAQMTSVALDAAGRPLALRTRSFSSSDPNIATIDATGLARGVAAGTVTLTATIDGIAATAPLIVTASSP